MLSSYDKTGLFSTIFPSVAKSQLPGIPLSPKTAFSMTS